MAAPLNNSVQNLTTRASYIENRIKALEKKAENIGQSASGESVVLQDEGFPKWTQPAGTPSPLVVQNSLCPTLKVPFIPKDGKLVRWYQCGPTTYAPSHLGHARAYVTFDIMRRLLSDYFGYNIMFVENITDIDDKIIKRARQNFLVEQYLSEVEDLSVLKSTIEDSFERKKSKDLSGIEDRIEKLKTANARYKKTLQKQVEEAKLKNNNTLNDQKKFNNATTKEEMLKWGKSVLAEKLDAERGASVTDNTIFRAHAEKYEIEFFEDMRNLNVKDPDCLTRVSEYVPDIVAYVERIIANGYGYASNGSVYFDTVAFRKTHDYGKLSPSSVGDIDLLEEGEGDMDETSEKRRPEDFALWKLSKPGEPSWESPWGLGRPGWHIECSCMSSDTLGPVLDIHTGGEDLKFPHHDNEMAQSEAYFSKPKEGYLHQQWVNYWFHAGHLHIQGLKMSKSLKNFVSIREMLELFSTRQIRIFFALQTWYSKMHYADETLLEAVAKEKQLQEFFLNIRSFAREMAVPTNLNSTNQRWTDPDIALNEEIAACMTNVDNAFRDNFDYPAAMNNIFDLIKSANKYMGKDPTAKILLLNKAAQFINNVLKTLGIVADGEDHFLGARQFELENQLSDILNFTCKARNEIVSIYRNMKRGKGGNIEQAQAIAQECLSRLGGLSESSLDAEASNMRDVFVAAAGQFLEGVLATNDFEEVMSLSDKLRDQDLVNVGVQIEDKASSGTSLWKLYYPPSLLIEKNNEVILEKKQNQLRVLTDEYNKWQKYADAMNDFQLDDEQLKSLSKSKRKKYTKSKKKAEGNYKKYEAELQKKANFMQNLEADKQRLEEEIVALRS